MGGCPKSMIQDVNEEASEVKLGREAESRLEE